MRRLLAHPLARAVLALAGLLLTMHALKAQWHRRAQTHSTPPPLLQAHPAAHPAAAPAAAAHAPRLVVAHFMLGNTYPFTPQDWLATFDLARDTSLDALALNLGPEQWQLSQARTAFSLLSSPSPPSPSPRRLKLFLSLDMNVLPASPPLLVPKILDILSSGPDARLVWGGGVVLSTFGGHALGDDAWAEVIRGVEQGLGDKVFFWPAFFLPPHEIFAKEYVDGAFAWNNAWPMGDHPITPDQDAPFLDSSKAYMAAVSPLFFTHYGTEGEWAWNKNWIYRSDDLLLPTRFSHLLSLPPSRSPSIIQIISWNDHGESHAISPVRGAEPGSEAWTRGMAHEGFRWMVRYYARRWRDGVVETREGGGEGDGARVVMWYRTQPKDMIGQDTVGRPDHADWARDLLNLFILLPPPPAPPTPPYTYTLHIQNGPATHTRRLDPAAVRPGEPFLLSVPFVPGGVAFEVRRGVGAQEAEAEAEAEVVCRGEGREITEGGGAYNFNMWSGVF